MPKHNSPMRLNEHLVSEAKVIAATLNRTPAEQIEYWSELGKRLSANLTAKQAAQFMTGLGEIAFSAPQSAPLDVMALAAEVQSDGSLEKDLLEKGQTLYSPAPEGGGILIATYPDGTSSKGRFEQGQFKPLRKRSIG